MTDVVSQGRRGDRRNGDGEIRPPHASDFHLSAKRQNRRNPQIHALTNNRIELDDGVHRTGPCVRAHKGISDREHQRKEEVGSVCNQAHVKTRKGTVGLFAYVNRDLILRSNLPDHGIEQEQVKYNGKNAHAQGKDIVICRVGCHGEHRTKNRNGKLIDKHFDHTV